MINNKKSKEGFTLIELLVVIAIIGILSSVVLASLNTAREKSRDARRISDIGQISLALELYFDSCVAYPAEGVANALPILTAGCTGSPWSTFMPINPVNPAGSTPGYTYELIGTTDYCLGVVLEDANHPNAVQECNSTDVPSATFTYTVSP